MCAAVCSSFVTCFAGVETIFYAEMCRCCFINSEFGITAECAEWSVQIAFLGIKNGIRIWHFERVQNELFNFKEEEKTMSSKMNSASDVSGIVYIHLLYRICLLHEAWKSAQNILCILILCLFLSWKFQFAFFPKCPTNTFNFQISFEVVFWGHRVVTMYNNIVCKNHMKWENRA